MCLEVWYWRFGQPGISLAVPSIRYVLFLLCMWMRRLLIITFILVGWTRVVRHASRCSLMFFFNALMLPVECIFSPARYVLTCVVVLEYWQEFHFSSLSIVCYFFGLTILTSWFPLSYTVYRSLGGWSSMVLLATSWAEINRAPAGDMYLMVCCMEYKLLLSNSVVTGCW